MASGRGQSGNRRERTDVDAPRAGAGSQESPPADPRHGVGGLDTRGQSPFRQPYGDHRDERPISTSTLTPPHERKYSIPRSRPIQPTLSQLQEQQFRNEIQWKMYRYHHNLAKPLISRTLPSDFTDTSRIPGTNKRNSGAILFEDFESILGPPAEIPLSEVIKARKLRKLESNDQTGESVPVKARSKLDEPGDWEEEEEPEKPKKPKSKLDEPGDWDEDEDYGMGTNQQQATKPFVATREAATSDVYPQPMGNQDPVFEPIKIKVEPDRMQKADAGQQIREVPANPDVQPGTPIKVKVEKGLDQELNATSSALQEPRIIPASSPKAASEFPETKCPLKSGDEPVFRRMSRRPISPSLLDSSDESQDAEITSGNQDSDTTEASNQQLEPQGGCLINAKIGNDVDSHQCARTRPRPVSGSGQIRQSQPLPLLIEKGLSLMDVLDRIDSPVDAACQDSKFPAKSTSMKSQKPEASSQSQPREVQVEINSPAQAVDRNPLAATPESANNALQSTTKVDAILNALDIRNTAFRPISRRPPSRSLLDSSDESPNLGMEVTTSNVKVKTEPTYVGTQIAESTSQAFENVIGSSQSCGIRIRNVQDLSENSDGNTDVNNSILDNGEQGFERSGQEMCSPAADGSTTTMTNTSESSPIFIKPEPESEASQERNASDTGFEAFVGTPLLFRDDSNAQQDGPVPETVPLCSPNEAANISIFKNLLMDCTDNYFERLARRVTSGFPLDYVTTKLSSALEEICKQAETAQLSAGDVADSSGPGANETASTEDSCQEEGSNIKEEPTDAADC